MVSGMDLSYLGIYSIWTNDLGAYLLFMIMSVQPNQAFADSLLQAEIQRHDYLAQLFRTHLNGSAS